MLEDRTRALSVSHVSHTESQPTEAGIHKIIQPKDQTNRDRGIELSKRKPKKRKWAVKNEEITEQAV